METARRSSWGNSDLAMVDPASKGSYGVRKLR